MRHNFYYFKLKLYFTFPNNLKLLSQNVPRRSFYYFLVAFIFFNYTLENLLNKFLVAGGAHFSYIFTLSIYFFKTFVPVF